MDAWLERQRNRTNYSLPLLGLSRHRSYKLTIPQRSSILQPARFSTIRFLLFVRIPYLCASTQAFISMDIYHHFPFHSILIQTSILLGCTAFVMSLEEILVGLVATNISSQTLLTFCSSMKWKRILNIFLLVIGQLFLPWVISKRKQI